MAGIPKDRLYLIYPETDGEPMAENTLQFEWIVLIKLGLEACFVHQADVFIAGDLFWYPVEGRPDIRLAPDVLVVLGRPKGHRGSYLQWLEDNIAPQVVFEILSPGNRAAEMRKKLAFYERYGVQEYYIYDPDHNRMEGYLRANDSLQPLPETALRDWVSPLLDIRMEWTPDTLRLYQADGKRFLSYLELLQFGEEAMAELQEKRRLLSQAQRHLMEVEARALQETQRANQETQRANQETQRAQRLAEKLRQLGIDPDET
ncbi:MAG TPA: Uma2 family endonuclease [Saprospiraceae bacterium]|mgnify:FL=1|nr:Uma2 family endonuclease [Saprospiraceae bacterium]